MLEQKSTDEAVRAYLPSQENIKKTIQRVDLNDLPSNPVHIEDWQEILDVFRKTSDGDNFYNCTEKYDLKHRIIFFVTL